MAKPQKGAVRRRKIKREVGEQLQSGENTDERRRKGGLLKETGALITYAALNSAVTDVVSQVNVTE